MFTKDAMIVDGMWKEKVRLLFEAWTVAPATLLLPIHTNNTYGNKVNKFGHRKAGFGQSTKPRRKNVQSYSVLPCKMAKRTVLAKIKRSLSCTSGSVKKILCYEREHCDFDTWKACNIKMSDEWIQSKSSQISWQTRRKRPVHKEECKPTKGLDPKNFQLILSAFAIVKNRNLLGNRVLVN